MKTKFANIVLEDCELFFQNPGLYFKGTNAIVFDDVSGHPTLKGPGRFGFTTYFNSLSTCKVKEYTSAKSFTLHLEARGASFKVLPTKANRFSIEAEIVETGAVRFEASEEFKTIELALPDDDAAVIVGFIVEAEGDVELGNCYYEVEFEDSPREVELALVTTTFKKESYVEKNIDLVKRQIVEAEAEMTEHFVYYVIDNGRTLEEESLSNEKIKVIPNQNVGGAGGFARGMIHAMEQEIPATHVLLMDDDVEVCAESIKRTYNLLRFVKEEYKDAFVSGAMLSLAEPDLQLEDTGFMTGLGFFSPLKPEFKLTKLADLIQNEIYDVPAELNEQNVRYAGWWYCCIPASQIMRNGLPLPMFVRGDDSEFACRCNPKFITMNSICVWHEDFEVRYNAAVERYQTTRNTMIAKATTGFGTSCDFMHELENNVRLELKKFNYVDAELCLDAFEDFMAGPNRYSAAGFAEKSFMEANQNKEKMVSLDELVQQAEELGIQGFSRDCITKQAVDNLGVRSTKDRLWDFITDNNQRFVERDTGDFAIISDKGWVYPAGTIRNKKYLIAVDLYNQKGAIRTKDTARYKEVMQRYKEDLKKYKEMKTQLEQEYQESRERVTSLVFWKDYLGLN